MDTAPFSPCGFPTTIPMLVRRLVDPASTDAQDAWDEFYRRYARPLLVFTLLDRRVPRQDAEDLVQSFFGYVLDRPRLQRFDSDIGRFRTYLLTMFKRFVKDEQVRQGALKRGGGRVQIGDIEQRLEKYRDRRTNPEEAFVKEWALTSVRDALSRCDRLLGEARESIEQQWLRARYRDPLQGGGTRPSRTETRQRMNLPENWARSIERRVRKLLRSCLEEQVRSDLVDPESTRAESRVLVQDGIQELLDALAE